MMILDAMTIHEELTWKDVRQKLISFGAVVFQVSISTFFEKYFLDVLQNKSFHGDSMKSLCYMYVFMFKKA
jgi:hypothetical protein